MTTNPQSEVKCCELCLGDIHLLHHCSCHKESPVSQSVEGWREKAATLCAHHDCGEMCDNIGLIEDTLSTLVKEMEARKRESDWNKIETGDYDAASKMRVADKNILFNAGISAAIEVVKKMK